MSKIYECSSCGVVSETSNHLCKPQRLENMGVYCGTSGNTAQMCDDIKEQLSYVCESCGRPAAQADMVCGPLLTC